MICYSDAKLVSKSKKQIEFIRLLSSYFESAERLRFFAFCQHLLCCKYACSWRENSFSALLDHTFQYFHSPNFAFYFLYRKLPCSTPISQFPRFIAIYAPQFSTIPEIDMSECK